MQVIYPRCCGLDIHKKFVVACLLITEPDGTVRKETRTHPSYNVAKRLVEFDFSITIPRERLRSGYGAGFQGAPLNCDQTQQHPDPRDSGRQGDEARTKQAADADRAPEL